MTSKDIKDIKLMTDGGGMVTPKKLIFESNLIFPIPQIQGVTIKGLFNLQPSNDWKKGILMSSDGIVKTLNNNNFSGEYTPLANIKSKDDILIIEYVYVAQGATMTWRWPDGTVNNLDVWADGNWDGHFKVETADEYDGLATYGANSVILYEHLITDQGKYHVVGLYEITEN